MIPVLSVMGRKGDSEDKDKTFVYCTDTLT